MLLALWFDFWNLADWANTPPPTPVVQRQQLGGPPHKRKRHERLIRADDEYWEEYEKMLRRLADKPPVPEDAPKPVKVLAHKRRALVERAAALPSVEALRAVDQRIEALSLQILEESVKSARDEEDALLALLLIL